jgi:hypothetical protein
MTARDEIEPPQLHRWLCICRQLMFEHPIDGASFVSPKFAEGAYMRPGWNKDQRDGFPPSYLYFDPTIEHVDRKLVLPENVDESTLNVIRHILPSDVRQTALWQDANFLTATLSGIPMPSGLPGPTKVISDIARYAALKRQTKEIMAVSPTDSSLFSGIDFGSKKGPDPAFRVAGDYMHFATPGIVARHMLSSIYVACYTHVPNMMRRRCQPATTMLMRKAEDLASAAYRLRTERGNYNAAGYFNLTYLAVLCAGTLITMCSNGGGRLDKLGFSNEQRQRLARLRQNVDELNAHDLGPAFLLPSMFGAAGVLRWVTAMARSRGKPPLSIAREQCLHPQLVALLAEPDCEQLDDASGQARYVRNLTPLGGLSIDQALEREASALRINLHDFVLN